MKKLLLGAALLIAAPSLWSPCHAQEVDYSVGSSATQILPAAASPRKHQRVCNITANGGATVWISHNNPPVPNSVGIPLIALPSAGGPPSCEEFGANSGFAPQSASYAITATGTATVSVEDDR